MIYSVLIIEDDEGIQTYLKELLLDNGYNVMTASDGITGLKIIKKSVPDLVLLDLGLPDMSGESVCAQIKKDVPDLRIIMLTARDTPHDIIQGLNLGADDYLTKPYATKELIARIRLHCAVMRSRKLWPTRLLISETWQFIRIAMKYVSVMKSWI